jgi:hypothetical protein
MIAQTSQCERCFSKTLCSQVAISLEEGITKKPNAGNFKEFKSIEEKSTPEIKKYFKKYIDCINLE